MNRFEKIYPNYKILGIHEILVEGVNHYYSSLINNPEDVMCLAKARKDMLNRKIRVMCLKLEGPTGDIRYADFSPDELI